MCAFNIYCRKLAGCTLFITGASRGIGKAIALKAARDGANVVIAAKTADPHPKLPGTIYTAAAESKTHKPIWPDKWTLFSVIPPWLDDLCLVVEAAGGKALPCIVDVRDEKQISDAVEQAVEKFGGELLNSSQVVHISSTHTIVFIFCVILL